MSIEINGRGSEPTIPSTGYNIISAAAGFVYVNLQPKHELPAFQARLVSDNSISLEKFKFGYCPQPPLKKFRTGSEFLFIKGMFRNDIVVPISMESFLCPFPPIPIPTLHYHSHYPHQLYFQFPFPLIPGSDYVYTMSG